MLFLLIKRFSENILKNEQVKNVLVLFSGNTISQLIPFIVMPILARWFFSQEQLGQMFYYLSVVTVLSVMSTLKFELSIILPGSNKDGDNLYYLSCIIAFIIGVIALILVLIFNNYIRNISGENNLGFWIYFIPFSIFFMGISQAGVYWLNRNKCFKPITMGRIYKATSTGVVQLYSGFSGPYSKGLIGGVLLGQLVHGFYNTFRVLKRIGTRFTKVSYSEMWQLAVRYKKVPLFNTYSGLLNTLSRHLPVLLLSSFFSIEIAALYGMALAMVERPMGLIGQSVTEIFFSSVNRKKHESGKAFYEFFLQVRKKLLIYAIIPFVALSVFGPYLFALILGNEWKDAGLYVRYLTPWLFFAFVNTPLTAIGTVLMKQGRFAVFETFLLSFRFFALFLGYKHFNSELYSIVFYGFVGLVYNVFLFFYLKVLARNYYLRRINNIS